MNILIINPYYYPNIVGGTENSIKLLCEELVACGNSVYVYTVDSGNNELSIEEINGVTVIRGTGGAYKAPFVNCLSIIDRIKNVIIQVNNYSIKEELDNAINLSRPDVIHTNNVYGFSVFIWKYLKEKYDLNIIHTIRDYWLLKPIDKSYFLSILLHKFVKRNSNYVDVVTAPSRYTLNSFLDKGYFRDSKSRMVPNAIKLDLKETKNIINKKRMRNSNIISFMFAGQLKKKKGILILLKAFFSLNNKDICLNIYGEGELETKVKEYCKTDSRIRYHGKLGKNEIKEAYIENDVLVVPSIWQEPFGRVVIEGNQYGLPVIGSDRGGIKEILESDGTGELYTYWSVDELRDKIIKFSDRREIIAKIDGIEEKIEAYSVDKQVNMFVELYKEII